MRPRPSLLFDLLHFRVWSEGDPEHFGLLKRNTYVVDISLNTAQVSTAAASLQRL